MKVTLEFDTTKDREQTIQLAVRAEAVDCLIDDLLYQLTIWRDENSNDQQALAFAQTHRWLCDEILNRGLYIPRTKQAVIVDRAGKPLPATQESAAPEQSSRPE